MKHYALIGGRLGHSLSVPIHAAIFDRLHIAADYRLIEVPSEALQSTVTALLGELDGFNVTIPYKQAVIPLLDGLDPLAQDIGAVNTVLCGPPSRGYNTDAAGVSAMMAHYGVDPCGKNAYVLGSGGSSRTVDSVLHRLGAKQVRIVSRTPRGDTQISYEQFAQEFPDLGGVIVNTTPVGMWPHTEGCPIDPALLRHAQGVVDLIYNPPQTRLTAAAQQAGVPACTGLYMLIHQAVKAEEIWQGRPLPEDMTATLMKELKLL